MNISGALHALHHDHGQLSLSARDAVSGRLALNFAALNPQPIPPGRLDWATLNPQPLPPNPCRFPA